MGDSPTDSPPDAADTVSPADTHVTSQTLLETVCRGIYHLDPDGYITTVNDALTDLTGYDRDTLLGTHVSAFLDAEAVVRAETAIQDQLLDGDYDSVHLSVPVNTATGETLPCEVCISPLTDDGDFHGTVGVVREIHDPETAATIRETGEHRQAFDALAEASADGIIMLDDDSNIRYANPAVERILGYTSDELVGGSKMQIIPERLRQVHAEALQRYLNTGEKHIDWTYVELSGLHRDGHEVPLAISLNEFTHAGEHYFVGTFRDISTRKEVEQELEQKNERLERFASMLAHELRNPLQVAQIYLDFVDDDDATIDEIADALTRIDDIIEVLLMLARGGETDADHEPVGLTGVAKDAWANTATGDSTIDITTTQVLRVKPNHLQQLLENLFRNAVEHSNGPVTVRVGALAGSDGFYVEDTGPGIPTEEREQVLDAGYTTENEGIGLGLTFVAELADAYGWDVFVTESAEGGARFEFTNVNIVTDADGYQ